MRSFRNPQKGAAVVEFAVMVGLLLVFLAGIFEFGFLWVESNYIASAAREGARVAAKIPGDDTDATNARQTAAEAAVEKYLKSSFLFNNVYEHPDFDSKYSDFVLPTYNEPTIKDSDGNDVLVNGNPIYMAEVTVQVKTEYIWDPILWPLLSAIIPGVSYNSSKLTQLSQSASFAILDY